MKKMYHNCISFGSNCMESFITIADGENDLPRLFQDTDINDMNV